MRETPEGPLSSSPNLPSTSPESRAALVEALQGLFEPRKRLPTWLLYDEKGSELFERITQLPEYYLTRAETLLLERNAGDLVARASPDHVPLSLAELGAGTAKKTGALIAAVLSHQSSGTYLGCDIAPEPLLEAKQRFAAQFPSLEFNTFLGSHREAGPSIAALPNRQVLLFLGSSIGNFRDEEAISLLCEIREFLREDALLVLGTDLKKDPRVIWPAYNDSQGVTEAFTLNVLARLNREWGCNFDLGRFRHVAEWNEATSNMEISLEARRQQRVRVGALGRELILATGERIGLEVSAKYDEPRIAKLLRASGFARMTEYVEPTWRYAVQLARVAGGH